MSSLGSTQPYNYSLVPPSWCRVALSWQHVFLLHLFGQQLSISQESVGIQSAACKPNRQITCVHTHKLFIWYHLWWTHWHTIRITFAEFKPIIQINFAEFKPIHSDRFCWIHTNTFTSHWVNIYHYTFRSILLNSNQFIQITFAEFKPIHSGHFCWIQTIHSDHFCWIQTNSFRAFLLNSNHSFRSLLLNSIHTFSSLLLNSNQFIQITFAEFKPIHSGHFCWIQTIHWFQITFAEFKPNIHITIHSATQLAEFKTIRPAYGARVQQTHVYDLEIRFAHGYGIMGWFTMTSYGSYWHKLPPV